MAPLQLFLRVYVEMYPQREEELVLRMSEGRFDIGGTWTEGYESSMLNESAWGWCVVAVCVVCVCVWGGGGHTLPRQ
jgi:allantoicase